MKVPGQKRPSVTRTLRSSTKLGIGQMSTFLDKVMAQVEDPKALLASFVASHPIGRLGKPEEIAAIAVYLASDESAFATGGEFVVDGGSSL